MKGINYNAESLKKYGLLIAGAVILTAGTIFYNKCGKKFSDVKRAVEIDDYGNIVSNGYYNEVYFSRRFVDDKVFRETYLDIDNDGLVDISTHYNYDVTPLGPLPKGKDKTYFIYRNKTDYREKKAIAEKNFPFSKIKGKRYGSMKGRKIQKTFHKFGREWKAKKSEISL